MAEPGRRARWTAALVAAPGAAAVLAGATAWAAHTRPATANGGSSPVVRAPAPADATTLRPVQQPELYQAALVLGAVCVLCLSYLNLRIRAVEVVR